MDLHESLEQRVEVALQIQDQVVSQGTRGVHCGYSPGEWWRGAGVQDDAELQASGCLVTCGSTEDFT